MQCVENVWNWHLNCRIWPFVVVLHAYNSFRSWLWVFLYFRDNFWMQCSKYHSLMTSLRRIAAFLKVCIYELYNCSIICKRSVKTVQTLLNVLNLTDSGSQEFVEDSLIFCACVFTYFWALLKQLISLTCYCQ